ncbi:MAG: phosphate ABC transporter substrate-binding protein PstS family protein [bacterium]|nr:phosphate ABC transporter substrate-binding protein PstS family protein [bacterium]
MSISFQIRSSLLFIAICATLHAAAQPEIDKRFESYHAAVGVYGAIKCVGSDTMNNLVTLWGEGFSQYYPHVSFEVEGKGSSTAPPALIAGAATFGPMSRTVRDRENDEFERKFGYRLTQLPVCLDVVSIFVNKDNPLKSLCLEQLDAIFSKNRNSGASSDISHWGETGLSGDWEKRPINIYGRNAASGTYGYFKSLALSGGDYKDRVIEEPGSSSAIQGISNDKYGIGYCGIGYRTKDVRSIAISRAPGSEPIEPTSENAYSGRYPLTRNLWLTLNAKPGGELDPLRREFIRYVFSREGQEAVIKAGFFPIPYPAAQKALEAVNLNSPETK